MRARLGKSTRTRTLRVGVQGPAAGRPSSCTTGCGPLGSGQAHSRFERVRNMNARNASVAVIDQWAGDSSGSCVDVRVWRKCLRAGWRAADDLSSSLKGPRRGHVCAGHSGRLSRFEPSAAERELEATGGPDPRSHAHGQPRAVHDEHRAAVRCRVSGALTGSFRNLSNARRSFG